MALGGSGPNNSNIDLAQFHGRSEEGYNDYSTSATNDESYERPRRPAPGQGNHFQPVMRAEPVHGEESMGLGTSTFLEGTPASRTAIHRRASDFDENTNINGAGLGRKKSLAMKFKGMSNQRSGALNTISPTNTPLATTQSEHTNTTSSNNPFFVDYDKEYAKKGTQISFAEEHSAPLRSPTSPRKATPMGRPSTSDSAGDEGRLGVAGSSSSAGGGFLSRVRSLKGGPRKPRGDKRMGS